MIGLRARALDRRKLTAECHSLMVELSENLTEEDLSIVDVILRAFPEREVFKRFLLNIVQALDHYSEDFIKKVNSVISNTDSTDVLCETLLMECGIHGYAKMLRRSQRFSTEKR